MPVNRRTYFMSWVLLTLTGLVVYQAEDSIGAKIIAGIFTIAGFYLASKVIPRGRVSPEGKAVFITGCDTGFGNGLARKLDGCGFTVLAGCYIPGKYDIGSRSVLTKTITIRPMAPWFNLDIKHAQRERRKLEKMAAVYYY